MSYELIGEQEDSLEGEFAVAKVEEVFERGTKEIKNHGVVVTFGAEPPHERDADTAGEVLVNLGLVLELRMLGLDGLELDGNLFTGDDVDAKIDVACGVG